VSHIHLTPAALKRFGFFRPFVTIENVKTALKKLKALNPDVVVPAHGAPGTIQLLNETDTFYDVLLDRVGKMMSEGSPLTRSKQACACLNIKAGPAENSGSTPILKRPIARSKSNWP
jgi:hypothetical protein